MLSQRGSCRKYGKRWMSTRMKRHNGCSGQRSRTRWN